MAGTPLGLPPDLPVPTDEGACDHLPARAMPPMRLVSTRGSKADVAKVSQRPTVIFFYPAATGKADMPGECDLIPGARGCTPQNCAYRDHYREFRDLGFEVYGVSAQSPEEQKGFADRMHIPYELLSDSDFELTETLQLPTFEFQGRRYIKRLTVVVAGGRIEKVFYPVFPPDRNAEVVLEYVRGRRGPAPRRAS